MPNQHLLIQAVELAKVGRKNEARRLLGQVLNENPENEVAWFWYVDTLQTTDERMTALEQFLTIKPNHKKAQRALFTLKRLASQNIPAPESLSDEKQQTVEPDSQAPHETALPENPPEILLGPPPYQQQPKPFFVKRTPEKKGSFRLNIRTLLIILCVVVACAVLAGLPALTGALATPEQKYARSMVKVIQDLDNWRNGALRDWEILVAKPSTKMQENKQLTYLEWLNNATSLAAPETELREALLQPVQRVARTGYDIQMSLDALSPPSAISTPHLQMTACVKYTVEWATGITEFLNTGSVKEMDQNPCSLLPAAQSQIIEFIRKNQ